MSTLEDALNSIQIDINYANWIYTKYDISPRVISISLYLWLDTNLKNCAPIKGEMKVRFNANAAKVCDIIRAIDKVTPIYKIKRKHKTYHITKTEEFMNKRCES